MPSSASNPLLPIAETFTSVQGEGKLCGTRSHFIRVSGCNLRCAWCDTPYASWNPEGARQSIDDLVAGARASGASHIVLTGGEPLIFPPLADLARRLQSADLHITIETAGTVFLDAPCDLLSLSPKLANSTPQPGDPRDPTGAWRARHEARRLDFDALQRLIDSAPDRQIKFVITRPDDLPEIESLLDRLTGWAPSDIFLMPEGVTPPDPETIRWVTAAAEARRWQYGRRLHIELFGNTRGT
ncbi:MAG: 7-carboxy-7-deazaguanine synthase QueE [Phycisphaerales bacterium JB039]